MTKFDRQFDVARLTPFLRQATLIDRLLAEWQLPGPDAAATRFRLRVAVRRGYLNVYARGQSVAKLEWTRSAPRLSVHHKYVGEDAALGRRAGAYVAFDWPALRDRVSPDRLDAWIGAAIRKAVPEKLFVDDLVSANPGTIDLEMALPGDPRLPTASNEAGAARMVSPRMDLVVLQPAASGLGLAFWEAKCADNGELRAKGDGPPPVLAQLYRYQAWLRLPADMDGPDRGAEVLAAYARAAAMLEALSVAGGKEDCAARALWVSAATKPLTAVIRPGIVIGAYCALGDAARTGQLARNAASFAGGHAGKLSGYLVEQYEGRPVSVLPSLAGDMVER